MNINAIINTMILIILTPITLVYLVSLYFISHAVFIEKTISFPDMFIFPFIGLASLWIISFKYKKYAAEKIPLGIIVGLIVGVIYSAYTFSRAETTAGILLDVGQLLLLTVILINIRIIRKKAPNKLVNTAHDHSPGLRGEHIFQYSIYSTIIATILTLIFIFIFKSSVSTVAIPAALATAYIITFWFGKSEKRLPSKNEKNKFIMLYWFLMLLIYIAPAYLLPNSTTAGILLMLVSATTYPMFMLILFKDKFLLKYVED